MQQYSAHKRKLAYALIPILIAYTIYLTLNFSEIVRAGFLSILSALIPLVMGTLGVLMVLTNRTASEVLHWKSLEE